VRDGAGYACACGICDLVQVSGLNQTEFTALTTGPKRSFPVVLGKTILPSKGGEMSRTKRFIMGVAFVLALSALAAIEAWFLVTPSDTSPRNVLTYVVVLALTVLAWFVLLTGICARLGISGVRPRKWIRTLFRIPDDYRPPSK